MVVDIEWLCTPTKSHKQLPKSIERRFCMLKSNKLFDSFVRLHRSQVTLIKCTDVREAALSIPFLVAVISAGLEENFKILIAQKTLTHYAIQRTKELIVLSDEECPSPLSLHEADHAMNESSNILLATSPNAFNYIEKASHSDDSQLTHLLIEGFDGDNCLDMQLLHRAIQLSQLRPDRFRVILVTDGLVRDARSRVEKLCDNSVSVKIVDLRKPNEKKPHRDVVVFNDDTKEVIEVTKDVYVLPEKSSVSEVNVESEESLSLDVLKKLVADTVSLIGHFLGEEIIRDEDLKREEEKNREEHMWRNEMKKERVIVPRAPFTYLVFTSSPRVMWLLHNDIRPMAKDAGAEVIAVRWSSSLRNFNAANKRSIILVTENVEDALVLDIINIVIDMGLFSWKSDVSSIGNNSSRTIWADRLRMMRRANRVKTGTVAYPFCKEKLQSMSERMISLFSGYDLDMKFFHDCKEWVYTLNHERTSRFMNTVEEIHVRSGLISYRDKRYCTPMGSFCSSVLPFLSPRLAKLVLCGIVCGCEDAAIALATILTEESAVIECSMQMTFLVKMIGLNVISEHLALVHAYDRRWSDARDILYKHTLIQNMEKREHMIRSRIKKEGMPNQSVFAGDVELEKKLLLAIAMAFGDRIGHTSIGDRNMESHIFFLKDPDNEDEKLTFDSRMKFPVEKEKAGVYNELRMRASSDDFTTEVSFLPVTILGAIGNIGGRVEKCTDGIFLNTNTGGLHVEMECIEHVDDMMEMRKEVEREVQRVALTYLQSDIYPIQFKTINDEWMNELIPLFSPPSQ